MSDSPNELELLKERADKLNISYHPTIGLEKLKEKVNAVLGSDAADEPEESTAELSAKEKAKNEAAKLIRVNVTCMNPNKKEHSSEIFTVSNDLGRWRKLVQFNTSEGYHIPNIIYQYLKEKQCQIFVNSVNEKGEKIRKGKLVKEFAIEVLPPLTKEELAELAATQAAKNSID